jgi:hypothetical protein
MRLRSRQTLVLAAVAGVLALTALYRVAVGRSAAQTAQARAGQGPQAADTRGQAGVQQARGTSPVTLDLDVLKAPRPKPVEAERDPFRFRSRPVARPALPARSAGGQAPAGVPTPSGPPPPAPIALKFIGVVDAPGATGRIAVLSDGRAVYHGREGDTIEGRYRIVRIGAESIEMAHADGRGRQTIRLTGQ